MPMNLDNLPVSNETKGVIARLESVWSRANNDLIGNSVTPKSLRAVLLFQFTATAHRYTRAVLAEIRGSSFDGIELILRSLIELLINAKYVLEDSTEMRARAYIANDSRIRLKWSNHIIKLLEDGSAPAMAKMASVSKYKTLRDGIAKDLEGLVQQHGEESLSWPSLVERARLSDTEELYATVFRYLSQQTHSTVRGLDRFLSERKDGSIEFRVDLNSEEIYRSVVSVYNTYVALLVESNERLGVPSDDTLVGFDIV